MDNVHFYFPFFVHLNIDFYKMEKRLTEKMDKNYNDLLNFFSHQKERNTVYDDEVLQIKRRLTSLEKRERRCKCYYCRFCSLMAS